MSLAAESFYVTETGDGTYCVAARLAGTALRPVVGGLSRDQLEDLAIRADEQLADDPHLPAHLLKMHRQLAVEASYQALDQFVSAAKEVLNK